jgi:anaerobic magnesium-protoporphyrin IX monomethyl ester cyclase
MRNPKIFIINARKDDKLIDIATDSAFPPLGVLSLATTLQHYLPYVDVRVFDGQIMSNQYIDSAIRTGQPDIVGISTLSASIKNTLHHAKIAKDNGATVILGNDYAAVLEQFLKQRHEIDYISTADVGELAFVKFVRYMQGELNVTDVPKLMYQKDGKIKHNDTLPEILFDDRFTALDQIPVVNRNLLPPEIWQTYLRNYLDKYEKFHDNKITGVTTMNRARGCRRAKDRCIYCGISDLSLRFSSPNMFWQEVRAGKEQVGANFFYEVFDNMTSAPKTWLAAVVAAKPPDLNDIGFFVYAEALKLDKEKIDLFKRLGVTRLNMGLDSGDDIMLKRLKGPQDSVKQNMKAVKLAKASGMRAYTSFVLGAPGETRASLENTVRFAEELMDGEYTATVEAQPLFPLANARTGRMLLNPEYAKQEAARLGFKIRNQKLLAEMTKRWDYTDINSNELVKDWASIFCEVNYKELKAAAEEIRDYAKESDCPSGGSFSASSVRMILQK